MKGKCKVIFSLNGYLFETVRQQHLTQPTMKLLIITFTFLPLFVHSVFTHRLFPTNYHMTGSGAKKVIIVSTQFRDKETHQTEPACRKQQTRKWTKRLVSDLFPFTEHQSSNHFKLTALHPLLKMASWLKETGI